MAEAQSLRVACIDKYIPHWNDKPATCGPLLKSNPRPAAMIGLYLSYW